MFHWCGGPDDLLYIPLYILLFIPGVKIAWNWARNKFGKKKPHDCHDPDCHKS